MLKADADMVKEGFVMSLEWREQDLGGEDKNYKAPKISCLWVHYHHITIQIIKVDTEKSTDKLGELWLLNLEKRRLQGDLRALCSI